MTVVTDDENRKTESNMSASQLEKKKYSDFVRIHAINGVVISRDDEVDLLKDGVTRFGLELEEATGILLQVVAEHDIVLVREAEENVSTFIEQLAKGGKISKKEFGDAVAIYRRLTKACVTEVDIQRRVKQMVEERGWRARKTRRLFGTRKWFKRI